MNILKRLKPGKKFVFAFVILMVSVVIFVWYDQYNNYTKNLYRWDKELLSCDFPDYSSRIALEIKAAKSGNALARRNLLDMVAGYYRLSYLNGCYEKTTEKLHYEALRALNKEFLNNPTKVEDWVDNKYESPLRIIEYYLYSSRARDSFERYQGYARDFIYKTAEFYKSKYLETKQINYIYHLMDLATLLPPYDFFGGGPSEVVPKLYLDIQDMEALKKEIYKWVLLTEDSRKFKESAEFQLAMIEMGGRKISDEMQELARENNPYAMNYILNKSFLLRPLSYEELETYYREIVDRIGTDDYFKYTLVGSNDFLLSKEQPYYVKVLEKIGCGSDILNRRGHYIWGCSGNLAYKYFKSGEYDKAEVIDKKILKYDNTRLDSLYRLGERYYKGLGIRQDLEKAKEYYGKLCDLKNQPGCDLFREVNEKIR
ncbi:SEL1-like repeat protein [Rodentibacter myodis]|uniref:Beta-lactamase n=1 Tax=Rodentibacter myodis TaxID=1907939 RepID=A0A1V3JL95_9PAST|nr:SEL1-like repeat protein [Rodentibacter myodis]OOF57424.1 hypothetical protein BKL49_08975 [Rodentibacter myodis]